MKNYKNLMLKELKLDILPGLYLFLLLNILLLVPSYPYVIVGIFSFIPVQVYLQYGYSNRDLDFMKTLPIRKKDIVIAKHMSVYFIQLLHIVISVPFALISSMVLNKAGNIVGTDANFALYGSIFIALAIFNLFLLPMFFKTGFKLFIPFVGGIIILGAVIILIECLIGFVPILKQTLDTLKPDMFKYQIVYLFLGLAIYIASFFLSLKLSDKNFKKVDL